MAGRRSTPKEVPEERARRRRGVPHASSEEALVRMKATRQRDTDAELRLRTELRRLGLHYRLHRAVVPGVRRRPDIVFGPARVAVFVDGCFWHGCPRHGTMAKANREFWEAKILQNKRRDRDTNRRLIGAGWRVVRVWEHEDPRRAARRIARVVLDQQVCNGTSFTRRTES
jgi:DNA mismatch endonuclease (patch repair protein)